MIWILTHTILGDKTGLAYDLTPLDGDLPNVKVIDHSVDIGIWPILNSKLFRIGRTLDTTNLPTRLKAKYDRGGGSAKKGGVSLPDFAGVQQGQIVSDRFKAVLETHDPGVHQFYPVDIVWTGRAEPESGYYWFAPGRRLFALDPVKSVPPPNPVSGLYPLIGKASEWSPVFRSSVVAGNSLFCSAELQGAILMTSEFKADLEASGLRGFRTLGPFSLSN